MTGKRKKQPNLRTRILNLIKEMGPLRLKDMTKFLDASYQSLNTELLELRREGLLEKDDEGVWSIVPEVDLANSGIVDTSDQADSGIAPSIPSASPKLEPELDSDNIPTFEEEFEDLLKRAGVTGVAKMITDIYFSNAYLWDAQWLYDVLLIHSAGFVTEDQARLIFSYWTRTKGIPCNFKDFFKD